jgi:hypothetical protein
MSTRTKNHFKFTTVSNKKKKKKGKNRPDQKKKRGKNRPDPENVTQLGF